jgi:hypothetical protein
MTYSPGLVNGDDTMKASHLGADPREDLQETGPGCLRKMGLTANWVQGVLRPIVRYLGTGAAAATV